MQNLEPSTMTDHEVERYIDENFYHLTNEEIQWVVEHKMPINK